MDYQVLLKGLPFPLPSGDDVIPALEEFYPETKDRLLGVEDCHALVSACAYGYTDARAVLAR